MIIEIIMFNNYVLYSGRYMLTFQRTLVQLQSGYTTEAAVHSDVLVIFLSTDNYESHFKTSIM